MTTNSGSALSSPVGEGGELGLGEGPGSPPIVRRCEIEGCDGRHFAKLMCRTHYDRKRKRDGLPANYAPKTTPRRRCLADDVDEAVVERLMSGEPAPYTSFERREAVRRLVARNVPKKEIARLLGVHNRQVWRDLAIG